MTKMQRKNQLTQILLQFPLIEEKLATEGDGICGKTCPIIVFFKDKFTEVYVPRAFKNDVADIEVHGKKVELIYMIQICQDRKIRTGYDLCPVQQLIFYQ